jgi:predicted metalloprotease with PDZ domain
VLTFVDLWRATPRQRDIARAAAIIACLWIARLVAAQSSADVAYTFTYATPGAPTVAIELAWPDALATATPLVMPRAIPMGYGEQPYDAFVANVRAFAADNTALTAERQEGPRWLLPAGTTRVAYTVDVRRMEEEVLGASDSSRVRDGYLGVLGYSVFAYVDGFESRAARVRIEGPGGWPVFATLAPRWPPTAGAANGRVADFYALADSQIVMGPRASIRRLTETPAPLYLAAYTEGTVDLDRVGRLATTAFQRVCEYFGTVPFTRYSMHQELLAPLSPRHQYGMSMEHLDSSTYYLAASGGLTATSTPDDEARVLYNFAHHISHAWVPKRSYGPGYFPFQWELAPVLDSIWFAEGFGQYAAIMAIAPATPDPAAFRKGMLARRFQANIDSAPQFLRRMTLVELSRIASTRYSEDFRTGRLVFSRGGLMAATMDDLIQEQSNGGKSLRDAFRFLVAWTARERRAFTIDELPGLIEQATGVDVRGVMEFWLAALPK